MEISILNGTEDTLITVYLSAHIPNSHNVNSSGLTIRITDYPPGSTFSKGVYSGQFWTLASTDFGEFQLSLSPHLSGNFEVTAEALSADSQSARMGTAQFTVQPVADTPVISIVHRDRCIEPGHFSFTIASSLVDVDGSEVLAVSVSGLPTGSQLSTGRVTEQGDYILDSLEPLTIITATVPSTIDEEVNINLTATATERMTQSAASVYVSISISKCMEGN